MQRRETRSTLWTYPGTERVPATGCAHLNMLLQWQSTNTVPVLLPGAATEAQYCAYTCYCLQLQQDYSGVKTLDMCAPFMLCHTIHPCLHFA